MFAFQTLSLLNMLLIVWCFFGVAGAARQPGVVTVINEQFFERETRKLFDDLEKELITSDDMSVHGKDGRIAWGLDRLSVYHFEGPTSNVEITSPFDDAIFTLELSGAAVKASFDWSVSYDAWFTHIRISGQADARMYGVGMTKSVTLGITDDGKLELESRNCGLPECCSLDITDVDISVYGNVISWIINKTIGWWEGYIKNIIKKEACKGIDDVLHTELNAAFREFPTHTDIVHEELLLNYTLLNLDTVGDCLVVGVDGIVTPLVEEGNRIGCYDLLCAEREGEQYTALPDSECVPGGDYDFSTRISHRTIQSLVDSVFHTGLLQGSYSLDKSTIQKVMMLRPGFFARGEDKLMQHYLLKMWVNITASPTTSINTNLSCIDVEIPTTMELLLLHPNKSKSKKLLLTLKTSFLVGLQFHVIKEYLVSEEEETIGITIVGNITRVSSTVHNITMNNYDIELYSDSVSSLVDLIMGNLIRPIIDKHLQNGIPTNFGEVFDMTVSDFKYRENYVEFDGRIDELNM